MISEKVTAILLITLLAASSLVSWLSGTSSCLWQSRSLPMVSAFSGKSFQSGIVGGSTLQWVRKARLLPAIFKTKHHMLCLMWHSNDEEKSGSTVGIK